MADEPIGRVQLDIEIPKGAVEREAVKACSIIQRAMESSLQATQGALRNMFTGLSQGSRQGAKDVRAMARESEGLVAKLDNINARIDLQQGKLARLREQYGYLTEIGMEKGQRGERLQSLMLNTENSIIELTQQSDKAAAALWKIDDAMAQTGTITEKTAVTVDKSTHKMAKGFNTAKKSADFFGKGVFNMGKQVTYVLKRVLRRVLLFGVMYKIVRGVITYVTDALKTNDEFAKSLGALKTSMKVAFQPILQAAIPAINALIRTLGTAMTYVASFISGLFGKSYRDSLKSVQQMEAAKAAMKGYGKAAKEARKSLLGIDEIHIVGDKGGAGGGAGEAPPPLIIPDNLDEIEARTSWLTKLIRRKFKELLKWLKKSWAGGGKAMLAPFGKAFQDLWNKTLKPLGNFAVKDYFTPIAESALNTLVPIFSQTIPWAFDEAGRHFQWMVDKINTLWEAVLRPVYELIRDVVTGTLEVIGQLWDEHGETLLLNISGYIDSLREIFDALWTDILEPIIVPALEWLSSIWDTHLKGIVKDVGGFILELINATLLLYNKVIAPIVKWLIGYLGPKLPNAFAFIRDVITVIVETISGKIAGIKRVLNGIIDFIAGVFSGDWKLAWNGLKEIAIGAFEGMWAGIKGVINLLIAGVNFMTRGLNKISFDIPNWSIFGNLAGKKFGLKIPQIPKLARGGIVTQPTLAMVGERSKKEAVLPLEGDTGWADLVAAKLADRLEGLGGGEGPLTIQNIIDGNMLLERVISAADRKNARSGRAIITVGVT